MSHVNVTNRRDPRSGCHFVFHHCNHCNTITKPIGVPQCDVWNINIGVKIQQTMYVCKLQDLVMLIHLMSMVFDGTMTSYLNSMYKCSCYAALGLTEYPCIEYLTNFPDDLPCQTYLSCTNKW